jgi:hypothetical protein
VKLTTNLHIVLRLRMGGAIPLLLLYAFRDGEKFTFIPLPEHHICHGISGGCRLAMRKTCRAWCAHKRNNPAVWGFYTADTIKFV